MTDYCLDVFFSVFFLINMGRMHLFLFAKCTFSFRLHKIVNKKQCSLVFNKIIEIFYAYYKSRVCHKVFQSKADP